MVLHLTILYKPYGTKYSKTDQLKYVEDSLKQTICLLFNVFKGCLPQISPGPFLITLSIYTAVSAVNL